MLTIRQIDKLFNASDFGRLARELLAGRAELSARTLLDCAKKIPCAALALIRLDEFAQTQHPLARQLLNTLLAAQEADGGWTDAPTTALVLRALSVSRGQGPAITRGLTYLQALQKDSGLWPLIPIRRADADHLASALTLHHLSHVPAAAQLLDLHRATTALSTYHHPALPTLRRPTTLNTDRHPSPSLFSDPSPINLPQSSRIAFAS